MTTLERPAPGAGPTIRNYRESDLAQVYDVCVLTAAAGGDARGMYTSDELMGDIFAGPYVVLEPELAFVLEDQGRVVGYVVGTADTGRFAAAYRQHWIPRLADRYPPTDTTPVTPSEHMIFLHHNPERMVAPELAAYPAHLHIDLLPAYQRRGLGRQLMARELAALAAAGAPRVHLGMASSNTSARAFYARLGFLELDVPDPGGTTMYLGRATTGPV